MLIAPDQTHSFKGWRNRRDKAALRTKKRDAMADIRAIRAAHMAKVVAEREGLAPAEAAEAPVESDVETFVVTASDVAPAVDEGAKAEPKKGKTKS